MAAEAFTRAPTEKKKTPMFMSDETEHRKAHWKSTLRITLCILAVWFIISFGCAILFRDWMDQHMPNVGSAPFGFWMAQQGSILGFVLLLCTYALLMNRLDNKHGYSEPKPRKRP